MIINKTFHKNVKQDSLYHNPVIIRVTDFNDVAVKQFREEFQNAIDSKQDIIPIVIDSLGGEVYSLLSMIDIIKHSPVTVATFVSSKAMSCGAVLFSCGDDGYRFISDNAYIMVHEASGGGWGKTEDLKVNTQHTEELNNMLLELLSKNCGKKKNFFGNMLYKNKNIDIFIDAKRAIDIGLADQIRTPTFKVSIEQKVELE